MASFQVVQLEDRDSEHRFLNVPSSPSSSSLSFTATAPNLPGAGRTVGLLLDNVGARLESNVNGCYISRRRRAKTQTQTRLGATADSESLPVASSTRPGTGKQRLELELELELKHHSSFSSSISSNATALNLPGPGRTMGLLFDYLRRQLESVLNVSVTRFGVHPSAVAAQIRRLCMHHRTTKQDRHSEDFSGLLTRKEKRKLGRLCAKLVGDASSPVHSTQRSALEEMLRLIIEDPLVYMAIQDCNLRKPDIHYVSDVLLSTARALGSPEVLRPLISMEITSVQGRG
ncbi:hypothetical protein SCHPADRAFT_288530 [Schizopora paradoxa]|uniref:Uncharacterized protein n=1 Tax=Schizopora paradoxa TaxID=27342 RepID=A0A0H2SDH2_9AGAM|nr:hypothetical protein SCHPADRAFT_288530 [Schizopora paradoxa]